MPHSNWDSDFYNERKYFLRRLSWNSLCLNLSNSILVIKGGVVVPQLSAVFVNAECAKLVGEILLQVEAARPHDADLLCDLVQGLL